ncbi:hypothetical protein JFU47_29305 [Pseudomonas sp. TH39(2020)]|uniref:hypothetical protein n=1 Tax=Pseudomonas sp. TH39(2020) TaxID=2796349 RepID=UPI0019133589|nr:hypothetical protein [Pseudomonas sp. TH39(2020)]MBK5400770.1 hypothetical protein [Pseudomonas sp. TH39(2020)]
MPSMPSMLRTIETSRGSMSFFSCPLFSINADPIFKQMILDAQSTDVIYTNKVTGMGTSFITGKSGSIRTGLA